MAGGQDLLRQSIKHHFEPIKTVCCVQSTLFRDPSARWLLPGDSASETPRLQLARTYSLMALACPSRIGGGSGRPSSLNVKDVIRMLVNSIRCVHEPQCRPDNETKPLCTGMLAGCYASSPQVRYNAWHSMLITTMLCLTELQSTFRL